jgi:hypothetical protein
MSDADDIRMKALHNGRAESDSDLVYGTKVMCDMVCTLRQHRVMLVFSTYMYEVLVKV